jgi:pilus assembly protein Flp/PilA
MAPPREKRIQMLDMMTNIFRADEVGATATEYAMLIVFVALAIAGGAQVLGSDLSTLFTNVGAALQNITVPTP